MPYKILSFFALVVLFYLIATSGVDSYFTYGDESGYFLNLELIDKYGISTTFLQHFSGMAGPLHPILHWLLKPITGAIPPGVRFVNFVILCFFIYHFRNSLGWRIAWIPMTFICAGYAMTEFPAMLFLFLSSHLLKKESFINVSIAGIFLALAIAGRWNYLALLPLFWGWYILKNKDLNFKNQFNFLFKTFVFVATSLSVPLWIFIAWGGLAPPEAAAVAGYGTFDITPHHFILSSCFAGLMIILLYPQWFLLLKSYSKEIGAAFVILVLLNLCFDFYSFLPAKSVFNRFLVENQQFIIAILFGALAIFMAFLFLFNLILQSLKRKNDWNYLFYAAAILIILLTAVKTTHIFSSRYPYQALPFLLLILEKENKAKPNIGEFFLGIVGISWGLITWLSYQHIYS